MSKYPFVYTVQAYDYDNEYFYLQNGIGICESYKDAADIIEQRYGNDLIAIKYIKIYEDSTVITLPEETFKKVAECLENEEWFETKCDEKGVEII
jgi:hypothetical protein